MRSDRINAYYLRLSLEDGDVADGSMEESCSVPLPSMVFAQPSGLAKNTR